MAIKNGASATGGFLARLRKDERGNIIALTAAAIFPLIGLIGGAVDMSRVYAVTTHLQAACDSGALSGRRSMGSAAWNTTSNAIANSTFATNFPSDFFGIDSVTRSYTGSDGRVTGTATAVVPMTLMRVFGYVTKQVDVTCSSESRIPNTDVMFVLDNTGSMNCAPGDTTNCTNNGGVEKSDSRMRGLRSAVNCFYEALAKQDTGEVCSASGTDPAATGLAAGIQLRVGFMPYSSNINVGKLIPTAYFADNWTYQSRAARFAADQNAWTSAATVTGTFGGDTPAARPTSVNYTVASSYSTTFTSLGSSGSTSATTIGGGTVTLSNQTSDTGTACTNKNNINSTFAGIGDNAGTYGTATTATFTAPTYPATQRTADRTRTRTNTVTAYRYAVVSNKCQLQSTAGKTSSPNTSWTQTQTATDRQALTWTVVKELLGWNEQPQSFNIAGLKSGTNWNNSVTIPNFGEAQATVNLSGQNSSSTFNVATSLSVPWTGCIEERQTYKNIDSNPSDEWNPIPAAAKDMDIDAIPDGTAGSLWAPALQGLIYGRYNSSGNKITTSPVSTTATDESDKLNALSCPAEAKKLTVWTNPTDIRTYTTSLRAVGSTYHDIGLLWGARFLSPDGIFGTVNSTDASGNRISIQRHVIFMTDGSTGTCSTAYTPYGTAWWDRRQTNKSDPSDDTGTTSCNNTYANSIVDARTAALCTAIKNKNITLWVVSFGAGVDAATITRLTSCASSSEHFFNATTASSLSTAFQEIALQISRLRIRS